MRSLSASEAGPRLLAEKNKIGSDEQLSPVELERNIEERLTVNNFDLLRLIFASMVMFFHIGVLSQAAQLSWLQDWISASFGLQGFFFVSGFLVTMSYDRRRCLRAYSRNRMLRIAPAYVAVVLTCAVAFVLLSRLSWASYFTDPGWRSYVFWNLLLANFVSPDLPGVFEENYKQAVNGSLWTIKIEVAFYCAVPLCAYLCRRAGLWRVLVVLFAASLAWRIGFEALARATDSGFWSKLAIQAPGQFTFFLAGAIAYHRTRLGLTPPPAWLALGAVAAYGFSDGLLHEAVAPIAVGVFAYWAAIAAPYLGRFGRYGDFSYGIYLYHWPVIQTYIAVGVYDSSAIGGVIATLGTVLILAVCSWYMLERRFLSRRSSASIPRVKTSAI